MVGSFANCYVDLGSDGESFILHELSSALQEPKLPKSDEALLEDVLDTPELLPKMASLRS